MTLTLRTDRPLVRAAARSTRYLHIAFAAPVVPSRADRRPLSVAFVLDRSGSMGGAKIRLARQAVDAAVRLLTPDDLFSIVVYDDRVDVLVAATQATAEARRLALDRLAAIDARGATDLHTGWLRGCEQVADSASPDTIARCILLSDGLANHGMTDREVLATRAAQLRSTHVVTSTLGVGADFDERLMKAMASSGGGNFYYVEQPQQIEDVLTSELGEALEVVARRARVDIDLPAGVEAELMHDFRAELDGRRLRI
ncbi:MAG TPA: VWA domain-containing protein, partial [Vicinamibacterales bacterium]